MADSCCAKCGSTQFEVKAARPNGAQAEVKFCQCADCGAVVGTIDTYNIPVMLERIANKLGGTVLF